MKLHLNKPLAVFDLETTGTNLASDRIVELSVVKIYPDHEREVITHRINPQMSIPLEASMVHGIYDHDVADAPIFADLSEELYDFLSGADLGGYNILNFDLPILVEEFLRSGVNFDVIGRRLLDAQKLFFLMEKRTLSAAYKFFCSKDLDKAHSAEADTHATVEVIYAMTQRYHGSPIEDQKGIKIGEFSGNLDDLHQVIAGNMVDLAGKMRYDDQGRIVFTFGKYKDQPVDNIALNDPGYIDWLLKGDFSSETKRWWIKIANSVR